MYKYQSKQISVTDFGMPLGMSLDAGNRWVKKAETVPWDAIEEKYASLFESKTGTVAKPLRLALGALLIQAQYEYSDEEVVLQIQETPCLQYFCGLPGYVDEKPFDSSLMVHFRRRLTPQILGEINEMVIRKAEHREAVPTEEIDEGNEEEPPKDGPGNSGTLTVDATCAPQDIRYPQDTSLLNEARENLEKMIDEMHKIWEKKPRTYRQNAHRDYLNFAKSKKKTNKQIRKARGQQLRYIRRDLDIIEKYLLEGRELPEGLAKRLETIKTLYEQQLSMFENNTTRVDDRIVSIAQPWIRPIVRGKAKHKTEFGAKLDISVENGFTRLEHTSFDAYNESENLIEIIERFHQRNGCYPKRVLADGIYRTRDNLAWCATKGIRLLGKPLGRPPKTYIIDKKQLRTDAIDRIEVERKISHAKGSFGLRKIRTRLESTSQTAIALSFLALNIAHALQVLLYLIQHLLAILHVPSRHQNLLPVQ